MKGRILIVDDDNLIRESLYEILKIEGYQVSCAANGAEGLVELEKIDFQIVIADLKMPQMDGIQLLKEIKRIYPKINVILITAYGSIETAVEAMRMGAFDYVTKPINDEEIKVIIEKALREQSLIAENEYLRHELSTKDRFHKLIGQAPQMQRIYSIIETVANTPATILIQGESGTGKRLIAEAIHYSDASRKDKPLIEISCGALPEMILESELFGHVKGSFTTAIRDRVGRFEMANGGTLFLDEIDTFSPSLQVKLLRVIQEKEFERVGDTRTIKVDVRILAAANQDLADLIKEGKFREDLYYRLNVINIYVPPLRERKHDIPLLTEYFLLKYSRQMDRLIKGIDKETLQALMSYHWPGNVRELENVIERAVILSRNETIQLPDLPEIFNISVLKNNYHNNGSSLREALEKPEREVIMSALEMTGGNRKKAAEILRINRTTLYNKMRKYSII